MTTLPPAEQANAAPPPRDPGPGDRRPAPREVLRRACLILAAAWMATNLVAWAAAAVWTALTSINGTVSADLWHPGTVPLSSHLLAAFACAAGGVLALTWTWVAYRHPRRRDATRLGLVALAYAGLVVLPAALAAAGLGPAGLGDRPAEGILGLMALGARTATYLFSLTATGTPPIGGAAYAAVLLAGGVLSARRSAP